MTETPIDSAATDLEEIMNALALGSVFQNEMASTFQEIANAHPSVIAQIAKLNPVEAATAFGCLLTIPEFQANCVRIETLVHLALMASKGKQAPQAKFIASAFRALGDGFCGHMEDPAEDVFVSTVRTPRGNFRVLEGIWEGNAFYLQRFLNVLEGMPQGSGYDELRDSVYALLKVSDL